MKAANLCRAAGDCQADFSLQVLIYSAPRLLCQQELLCFGAPVKYSSNVIKGRPVTRGEKRSN